MKTGTLIICSMVIVGCKATSIEHPRWQAAPLDPTTTNVIVLWLEHRASKEPVLLKKDYGMFLFWRKGMKPDKRFYLFDNVKKEYFGTADIDTFIQQLELLPRGITIEWIDTCTVPSWNDMPSEAYKTLSDALSEGDRKETRSSGEPFIVDICDQEPDYTHIRFIDAEQPVAPDTLSRGGEP